MRKKIWGELLRLEHFNVRSIRDVRVVKSVQNYVDYICLPLLKYMSS